jgi:hypothetical protein
VGVKAAYQLSMDASEWGRIRNLLQQRCGAGPIADSTATTVTPTTVAGAAGGRVAPNPDGSCPPQAPIKGNADSGIYHRPGQHSYNQTKAEDCFATPADAEAAGYRAAKN